MNAAWELRPAAASDSLLIATHRVAMFRDMKRTTPAIEPALFASCADYLATALARGEYVGWVAQLTAAPHTAIAGAGVQRRPLIPRPDPAGRMLLAGLEGLIVNVYVDPLYRRQGLARQLLAAIIDWAPGAGIVRLVLHASPDGRPLYESLGFQAGNEMLFPPFAPRESK